MKTNQASRQGAALDTVIIFTNRLEELAGFYQDGLELGAFQSSDRHVGQQLGPVYFGFDRVERATSASGAGITLWFTVDDLQATFDRLVDQGARVGFAPTRKPWGAELAMVYDPDGNVLGLSQRRPDSRED